MCHKFRAVELKEMIHFLPQTTARRDGIENSSAIAKLLHALIERGDILHLSEAANIVLPPSCRLPLGRYYMDEEALALRSNLHVSPRMRQLQLDYCNSRA